MEEKIDAINNTNKKNSEKVKKSIWTGFLYSELIIEFILIVIISTIFKCSCGYSFINPLPVLIAYILKIMAYKLISKKNPDLLSSHKFVWFLIIFEIISFILICALSKNDLTELHKLNML